ncbi:hypothetical protein QQS21_012232 [Conoideocrella luteorostrata]|uniref:RING-type E3 ubiquitin transferase n=1 Tax=Conoideocrella luteorostrata TaxID=1105319 RepID=A0AAJ0CBU8_9HYPO|nr:hypothetical protein QQS21_012232 [Conoideocrella luteorostrata]
MAGLGGGFYSVLLAYVLLATCLVSAQDDTAVFIEATQDVPKWAKPFSLTMELTPQPGGRVGVQFTVIPLTKSIGLNVSAPAHGAFLLKGELKAANISTYNDLRGDQTIAYLSCDPSSSDGFITPDKMLSRLMKANLTAIVLYSTDKNICLFKDDAVPPYSSILSMADAGEAGRVLTYLNGTQAVHSVSANITDSTGHKSDDTGSNSGGGNNSAVAMSILYSITGIITLLFLVIIATGAIRAHRYPERYGPRGGFGGRPRQSRAKGLARAVLDTIPIVKFGNQQPVKHDPELELDPAATDVRDAAAVQRSTAQSSEDQPTEAKTAAAAARDFAAAPRRSAEEQQPSMKSPQVTGGEGAAEEPSDNEGHLGCSICTEDFRVGEDVRVLPCNHQFHPHCVDPWLVNVSGTCPLCRLDLRPDQTNNNIAFEQNESLAPPLILEGEDGDSTHGPTGNRFSRLFDVNRLRHAPVEERIEALRQMRAQSRTQDAGVQESAVQGAGVTDRPQAARLTDKLKDKFRVRTRAQSAN